MVVDIYGRNLVIEQIRVLCISFISQAVKRRKEEKVKSCGYKRFWHLAGEYRTAITL